MKDFDIPISVPVVPSLISPLMASEISFESLRESFGLSAAAARTLDDVRFLTRSILSPTSSVNNTQKIRSTASWIQNRIESLVEVETKPDTPDIDVIDDTIRMAGLLYARAVASRKPFSASNNLELAKRLRNNWMRVNVEAWKRLMGISGWILSVGCIGCGTDRLGKFLRRKTGVTGMAIGMENFPLIISTAKLFWMVQRWLAGEDISARLAGPRDPSSTSSKAIQSEHSESVPPESST